MNINRTRESHHGLLKLAALLLPMLTLLGCESAASGHAPGLAGGQTLTPGITNYPLAYIKQPVLTAAVTLTEAGARRIPLSMDRTFREGRLTPRRWRE